MSLDESLFRAINRWPDELEPLMRFLSEATNYWPVRLILLAMVVWLITQRGARRAAGIQALIAFPIANGITDLFKHNLPQPRPCNALADVWAHGIGCSDSMGTASAHSANMAAVATVFVFHLRGWGSPWVVIALLTGLSRIYHGAHMPSQVLLGWTCGILAALAVCSIGEWIRNRRIRHEAEPSTVTMDSAHEVREP